MRRRELIGPLLAGFALAAATPAAGQTGADLSGYRWARRLLLVFAPVAQDPRLAAQRLRIRDDAPGYADRDLTIIEIVGSAVLVDGKGGSGLVAATMRTRFEIRDNDFATVLLGKDGGEKLRRQGLMPTERLFETIDAMPMRREEMRRDRGRP